MPRIRISESERRQRAKALQEHVASIPHAQNNPFAFSEKLAVELDSMMTIIEKLKAFVRFLSKLNPMEYLRWMQKAFASYQTQEVQAEQNPIHTKEVAEAFPESTATPPKKGTPNKKPALRSF